MDTLFELDHDKTFIRYMGGKQYGKKKILTYLPPNLKTIVSPFIGGGSVELLAATKGIRVNAYDNLPALVRHWNIMLTRAGDVIRAANTIFPVHRRILKDLIVSEKIHSKDIFPSPEKDIAFAALAMCMTRQGFNGYYMKTSYFRGLYDPKEHDLNNPEHIERLEKDKKVLDRFEKWDEKYWNNWGNKNLSVDLQHWELTLAKHKYDFLFCDPPYVGKEEYYGQYETKDTQYKQEPFNHALLCKKLSQHKNGAIITYQDDPEGVVRDLYSKHDCFDIIETSWHQGSRKSQGSDDATELIILKEPAMRPSKRSSSKDKIGDKGKITRVYGGYFHKPPYTQNNPHDYIPETLCEWIEKLFSVVNPGSPCRLEIESILKQVPFDRYTCTKTDVHGIIESMVERNIIIEDKNNSHNYPRFGYPKYEIKNMNKHIQDMRDEGIPVKAIKHFSYDYDETA